MTTPPRTKRCYRSHPATVERGRHDGGTTLFNAARRSRIELNESGAFIWGQLCAGQRERQVVRRLHRNWPLSQEEAAQTVAAFVDQLMSVNALVPVEPGALSVHPLDTLERLINCLSISSVTPSVSESTDWEAVLASAVHHEVGSALYPALRRLHAVDALPNRARGIAIALHRSGRLATSAIRRQALEAVRTLNAEGIDLLALKGVGMLLAGELRPGERQIGDIDLLVPAARATAARAALEAIGYEALPAPDVDYARHHHLPPLVRGDDELPIELHVELLPRAYARLLAAHEVWSAARPIGIEGARLWLPDATHQILHGIVHCTVVDRCYARGVLPLRALLDLRRQREQHRNTADWRFITERMTETGALNHLRTHLHAAHRLFGMDLPRGIELPFTARIGLHHCLAVHGYPWVARLQRWADHLSADSLRRRHGRALEPFALTRARVRLLAEWTGVRRFIYRSNQ